MTAAEQELDAELKRLGAKLDHQVRERDRIIAALEDEFDARIRHLEADMDRLRNEVRS